MDDAEAKRMLQELICQIQDKSVQLSDLEIILEDYQRERSELLREIARLKASLWELSAEAGLSPRLSNPNSSVRQPTD